MYEQQELQKYRDLIDQIDNQLLTLVNQRAQFALKLGEVKIKYRGSSAKIHVPKREEEIILRLNKLNKGPLTHDAINSIFKILIKKCRELEISHGKN